MQPKIHCKIAVEGKVQGVWFRKFIQEQATKLEVKGWVKNLPSGSVYIEAESDENTMKQFVELCKQGSPLSQVEEVLITQAEVVNYTSFEIRF
ncbi:MAG: acylphosphatase [Chitinophagales bacterium]|nr:acylphosphatase [Chitinophagales bacterium]